VLNPNLGREAIAAEFAKDGRVRIADVLDDVAAEQRRFAYGVSLTGWFRAKPL
jgi:hypothetical protein